jgi:hypothetical protein
MQSKHVSSAAHGLRLYQAIKQATICFPMKNLVRVGNTPQTTEERIQWGNMPSDYTKKN